MIIKASLRSGAKSLATHLLNRQDNDHVEVHSLRGFITQELTGALREIEAVSKATRASKYLFSISVNAPKDKDVSDEDYLAVAGKIEAALHLKNQPRAVVFHDKAARRHMHLVYSRIDQIEIKAIKLDFFKRKLNQISREIFIEQGWDLPKGFVNQYSADPRSYNLGEYQQGLRHNVDPKQIKAKLAHCWHRSDNKASFINAIKHEGFFALAKGNRRNFVVVDWFGEVHSLSRATGAKAKDLKSRLGDSSDLQSVDEVKASITQEQHAIHKRLRLQQARKHAAERAPLNTKKDALVKAQRQEREAQRIFHEKRQRDELIQRQSHYQRGIRAIWSFISGATHKLKKKHEAEYQANLARDNIERHQLYVEQRKVRTELQASLDVMKQRQQQDIMALNTQISRQFFGMNPVHQPPQQSRVHQQSKNQDIEIGLS